MPDSEVPVPASEQRGEAFAQMFPEDDHWSYIHEGGRVWFKAWETDQDGKTIGHHWEATVRRYTYGTITVPSKVFETTDPTDFNRMVKNQVNMTAIDLAEHYDQSAADLRQRLGVAMHRHVEIIREEINPEEAP